MEEEDYEFQRKRKRAHGRDKNDKRRKTLPLKVRELNPLSSISYVQVLGTGMDTQDTSPSVLLFFDNQRFIFNAGEGLQRFCTEHKIKLSKIDHIFLSRVCSETAGGLPGLLLTLDGIGDGVSVNVWGPSDLEHLKNAMGSFIPQAAILRTHSFGSVSCSNGVSDQGLRELDNPLVLIDNKVVKISAIILRSICLKEYEILKEEATSPSSSQIENGKEWSPSYKAEQALKHQVNSVIYVCELNESKGKFDPQKAAALGLKPGPKYRELQLGNSVKSDHQDIMVHPTDVMGPSVIGPIVLLVDCPTLSHLRQLLCNQSLDNYYTDVSGDPAKNSRTVNCVIHLSPAFVVDNSDYRMWMSRFRDAKHVLAGHVMKSMEIPILKSSARLAARLNFVCPQFFPAPGFWSHEHLKHLISDSKASTESPVPKPREAVYAENLLKFNLRPHAVLGLDRSGTPAIVAHSDVIDELISEIPESVNAAHRVSQLWKCGNEASENMSSVQDNKFTTEEPWLTEEVIPSCLEGVTRDDVEIILLGTGSSQPSKYRNVTSIFINLFSKGSLLLDCGEGTLGQLKRRFGIDGADDAVRGLRCIWISHIHADHHTGLARILARRRDLLMGIPHAPLLVIGPCQLKIFLDAYQKLEDLDMQFLDCRHTMEASLSAFESNQDESYPESLTNSLKDPDMDCTFVANGGRTRSCSTRPGSRVDVNVVFPLLKKLKIVLEGAGLKELSSFHVTHCEESFGVALKAAERVNSFGKRIPGWKIVYSGDTRPCCETVKASYGATVLIHEATFEDKLLAEAVAKCHSTTKEAIEVGVSAGVYRIILTHFSQRYPKIPALDRIHMDKTCVAFDMMSVNLADLQVLPKVLPYLKLLFRDEVVTEELDDGPEVATVAV